MIGFYVFAGIVLWLAFKDLPIDNNTEANASQMILMGLGVIFLIVGMFIEGFKP